MESENTVSWTKSGFRKLLASQNPHPTQSVGVVQLEEVKFSKTEIAALGKILSKTSQFNKNPELLCQ